MHERQAKAAVRGIAKHGRAMELIVTEVTETPGPAYDPGAAEASTREVITPLVGLQTEFSSTEPDGDLVRKGDFVILFDGRVVIPTTGQIRDRDGALYSVVDVRPVKPGATLLLQRVYVAR